MSRVGRAGGRARGIELGAIVDGESLDGTLEQSQSSDRLIVRDLVSSLVDAREGEVAVLPALAVLHAIDRHWCVAGLAELLRVRVVQVERDGLAAEPVADVVGVSAVAKEPRIVSFDFGKR